MKLKPNGEMEFNDIYELNYELLNELDMSLKPNGVIYDKTNKQILGFNGLIVKGSIKPDQINYAGQGEIEFDILNNVRMATTLFGLHLQRKINDGMEFISYYTEEKIDDNDIKSSNLTVKFTNNLETSTKYYNNKCLKFVEMIFILEDVDVDLSNFDILE